MSEYDKDTHDSQGWGNSSPPPQRSKSGAKVFLITAFVFAIFLVIASWAYTYTFDSPSEQNNEQKVVEEDKGIFDSPLNLDNMEQLDNLNLDGQNLVSEETPEGLIGNLHEPNDGFSPDDTNASVVRSAEQIASRVPKPNDGFKRSAYDAIGSIVEGSDGNKAGTVHDILINKKTGEARGIVLNEDGIYYDHDLKILRYNDVKNHQSNGSITMTMAENVIEEKPDFDYDALDNTDYISLRNLREGKILTPSGDVMGQIDAIIYRNAKAQNIYFSVKPDGANQKQPQMFQLSYDAVNIVENDEAYNIQLTPSQMEFLSKETE